MRTKVLFFSISIIFFTQQVNAQQTVTGDLFTRIETILATMPGSSDNNYAHPDAAQTNSWAEVIAYLLKEDYAQAANAAATIGYTLVDLTENTTGKHYYILENTTSNHWGTYVFNPNYTIPVVIQAPHPRYDTNTGLQAIYIFEKTDALFYCVSGTHRCNSLATSSCSGTTAVCGSSGPYKISDMAHSTNSIFQQTTDSLFTHYTNSYFISLHGFAKGDTDPYVILSNGTRETPADDYLLKLKDKLRAQDNVLTFKIAHVNTTWTRLIGFTNAQGRLINNSPDPCNTNATATTGRFIHMEQEKSRLRADEAGWTKVANAIKYTFSDPVTGLTNKADKTSICTYPNPGYKTITLAGVGFTRESIKIFSANGRDVTGKIRLIPDESGWILDVTQLRAGTYIVHSQDDSCKIIIGQ